LKVTLQTNIGASGNLLYALLEFWGSTSHEG
jgi:hypothetical protein